MRRILGLVTAAALVLATAQNVAAQQRAASAPPATASDTALSVGTQQRGAGVVPRFSVFGLPIAIGAPVKAPYSNRALTTFAGQPMTGRDAVAAIANGAGG